jgi:hypothetical protein
VAGATEPVRACVFAVAGDDQPWSLVTTSATLTAAAVLAVFAAWFRQEDGFRDHQPRLGLAECRAWTKAPVERTFAVPVVAHPRLRLWAWRLDAAPGGGRWWSAPDGNRRKAQPALLDVRRAVGASRTECAQFRGWLAGQRASRWEPRRPGTGVP